MNKGARAKALYLPPALRPLAPWLPIFTLFGAALFLFIMNVFFPGVVSAARTALTDAFTPVLGLVARPVEAGNSGTWLDVKAENEKLREENAKLKALIPLLQQYEAENKDLRGLTKYKDDSTLSFLTTHVIGQPGGGFTNSAIVTAGARDGVRKDMIALTEDGVAGRVIEVGEWSSRILLLNDMNFRLPVQLEEGGQPAILAGEGEGPLKLLYLAKEIEPKPGMRLVTSGRGGIFPAYLPVGVISEINGKTVQVAPFARLDGLNTVRLARYDLAGGAQNALNAPAPATGNVLPPAKAPVSP